ncbi:MoaD/ThiS family protein [Methanolobus sp. ZRKC2]|uniref:MoaD/ThiS family protein n=1 Tax=Methanolobus sp. ZRKC2 TaxID=3125783 RepID=UPI00324D6C4F
MKVTLHSGKIEELEIESLTVEELLRTLGISQSEVLVTIAGEIVPEDRVLSNEDEVRIIHVVFGG